MNNKFSNSSSSIPHWVRLIRATIVAAIMFVLGVSLGFCNDGGSVGESASTSSGWQNTFSEASNEAKANHKPMMLLFTGSDWCIYCKKLDKEILETPEFEAWSKRFVKMKIDYKKNSKLSAVTALENKKMKERYGDMVNSFPTVLFLNEDGSVVGKMGYAEGGSKTWIAQAANVAPVSGGIVQASHTIPVSGN